jgi:hypothetical protein
VLLNKEGDLEVVTHDVVELFQRPVPAAETIRNEVYFLLAFFSLFSACFSFVVFEGFFVSFLASCDFAIVFKV